MSARTILTLANGKGIDLLGPTPEDIDFRAYAEMLAKEARYNGATPGVFYSVAQHLVVGCDAIKFEVVRQAIGWKLANLPVAWLLHDVLEGALKDDPTPKKRAYAELIERRCGVLAPQIMSCFVELDDMHDRAIHAAAGVEWPHADEIAHAVKRWDKIMFVTEWRDLMKGFQHPNWSAYEGIEPLAETIEPWPWERAMAELLDRFTLLPALREVAA